jgi:NADP-dependent 3-hydroxy acid dehydrogenase YdfG
MSPDENTVCFITGAGSGFGLECTKHFLGFGCKVVMTDIKWTDEAETLINKNSEKIRRYNLDITNE